ncbi:MAG: hypothetical protein D6718_05140 [Acidobacteria bacterium]|nr:MAG: hypothetical protein D6718_05140 [Acidobacteriota bacterium]
MGLSPVVPDRPRTGPGCLVVERAITRFPASSAGETNPVRRETAVWLLRLIRDEPPPVAAVPPRCWESVADAARAAGVGALVAHRVLGGAARLPEPAARRFREFLDLSRRRSALFLGEADRALRALDAAGVPAVVLKGVGLAGAVYRPPELREFRDIDILVEPAALEAALGALGRAGFGPAVAPEVVELHRRYHFHLQLERAGAPPLELHWSAARPDDPYRLEAELLLSHPRKDGPLPRPSDEAQLLHVAVSELRVGFTDLRRLVDLDRVVRANPRLDWRAAAALARERGLAPALRAAVELAAELLGTPTGTAFAALRPLGARRRRLDELGFRGFPLGLPPSDRPTARHLVRLHLDPRPARAALRLLRLPAFERKRLKLAHVSPAARLAGFLKRAGWLAAIAVSLPVLRFRPHSSPLPLTTSASPPSSERPGAGTAGTRGRDA